MIKYTFTITHDILKKKKRQGHCGSSRVKAMGLQISLEAMRIRSVNGVKQGIQAGRTGTVKTKPIKPSVHVSEWNLWNLWNLRMET